MLSLACRREKKRIEPISKATNEYAVVVNDEIIPVVHMVGFSIRLERPMMRVTLSGTVD